MTWGFFVIADSAQFSTLVTESVPGPYRGNRAYGSDLARISADDAANAARAAHRSEAGWRGTSRFSRSVRSPALRQFEGSPPFARRRPNGLTFRSNLINPNRYRHGNAEGVQEFLLKQNVVALAIAVVVGTALNTLVKAVVDDFIMPIIVVIGPGAIGKRQPGTSGG